MIIQFIYIIICLVFAIFAGAKVAPVHGFGWACGTVITVFVGSILLLEIIGRTCSYYSHRSHLRPEGRPRTKAAEDADEN